MIKNPFHHAVLKYLSFYVLILAMCKIASEFLLIGVALFGLYCAATQRSSKALACYVFFPLVSMINPDLISRTGSLVLTAKFGSLVMMGGIFLLGARQCPGKGSLPLGCFAFYLVSVGISSVGGWCPIVSFLKLAQFALFLGSLYVATINIQRSYREMQEVRAALMALAIIIFFGSLAVLPFPNLAYSMMVRKAALYGIQTTGEEIASNEGNMLLFNGICYHSQALAPIAAVFACWVLCDMLFVVRKLSVLHLSILLAALPVLYMTRSRTALIAMVAAFMVIYFYGIPSARMSRRLRSKVRAGFFIMCALIGCYAVYSEVRHQTITKWLRKTDRVGGDNRELMEAVTESRQVLVNINMRDYNLNPFLGKGFQVMEWHANALAGGRISIFSAPIEKGVLPLMVLGESGIIGSIIFTLVILYFFGQCVRNRYAVFLSLFVVLLVSNMGEASFFSPAGQGGVMWVVIAIGGFGVDMIIRQEALMQRMGGAELASSIQYR